LSELARITAHYLAVLMKEAGKTAGIPDMHAEIAAAAAMDADAAKLLACDTADSRIERIRKAAADETERGRQARRS
jgi:hypothetical protein